MVAERMAGHRAEMVAKEVLKAVMELKGVTAVMGEG